MEQRFVYLLKNRQSFLLKGDADAERVENRAGVILPLMMSTGWRVVSIWMTASAAVNDDQVLGIALVEKE
jgi:hypothetical protein